MPNSLEAATDRIAIPDNNQFGEWEWIHIWCCRRRYWTIFAAPHPFVLESWFCCKQPKPSRFRLWRSSRRGKENEFVLLRSPLGRVSLTRPITRYATNRKKHSDSTFPGSLVIHAFLYFANWLGYLINQVQCLTHWLRRCSRRSKEPQLPARPPSQTHLGWLLQTEMQIQWRNFAISKGIQEFHSSGCSSACFPIWLPSARHRVAAKGCLCWGIHHI